MSSSAYAQTPTIRVGLFAHRSTSEATVTGYAGVRVSQRKARGPIRVVASQGIVTVYDSRGELVRGPFLTVGCRAGRYMDIRIGKLHKRTVGFLQLTADGDRLKMINAVPLETYVLGIVEGELGSLNFSAESMKAQIVASRSYVLATKGRHHRAGYDFCDGPHCQVYDGTEAFHHEYKIAMEVSRGEYMAFNGKPIPGFFHDSCGGRTASATDVWKMRPTPYLSSVDDGGKQHPNCGRAPLANWEFTVDRRDLRTCFARNDWIEGFDALDTLRVAQLDGSGRARHVLIQTEHPKWVHAAVVRRAVNRCLGKEALKSTVFDIEREGLDFRFIGRGWGHGVGLCQWGTIALASKGKNYREILQHYYPGTTLDRLPEPAYARVRVRSSILDAIFQ